jgi:small subunit ribosomal protein S9
VAVDKNIIWGVGRRKTSVARVRLKPGTGVFMVNGRDVKEFFPVRHLLSEAVSPVVDTGLETKYDIHCNVDGGGVHGQAGAVRLGLARALARHDEGLYSTLRQGGHTTRDSRMKERKKYGLRGARRATQFSKR